MKSHEAKIALNAFRIANADELSWPVVYYSVKPAAAGKPLERGDAKTIAFEARRVGAIERYKFTSVEAHDAGVSREPEVSILGLRDGVDGVLRQPTLDVPNLIGKILERLGRRRMSKRARGNQHEGECDRAQAAMVKAQDHSIVGNASTSPSA